VDRRRRHGGHILRAEPSLHRRRGPARRAVQRGAQLIIPAFAVTEVACTLAHKHRDAAVARRLTGSMLTPSQVVHVPVDARLLATSVQVGTGAFLRGADALYAATAQLAGAALVSWDNELIQRAGALTPTAWLAANP
jgi:predicted nucleic acid-binding protein